MNFTNQKKDKKRNIKRIFLNILKPFFFIYRNINKTVYKIFKRLIFGAFIAFVTFGVFTSILRFDKMKSSTMLNTIEPGKMIVTSKLKYAVAIPPFISSLTGKTIIFSRPKRGDIAFMRDPRNVKENIFKKFISYLIYFFTLGKVDISNKKYIIKRIVALPNESIEIKDKTVYINGEVLNEPWATTGKDERILSKDFSKRDNFGPYIVGYNEYFVLSDNRDYGYDSRDFGSVSFSLIEGKVISK